MRSSVHNHSRKPEELRFHTIIFSVREEGQCILGNVCEAKFSNRPYVMTGKYLQEMFERMEDFRDTVKTNAALHLTMIASDGLATNEYSSEVQSVVTLDVLFKS